MSQELRLHSPAEVEPAVYTWPLQHTVSVTYTRTLVLPQLLTMVLPMYAHVHEISRASSVREAGMAYVVLIEQALLIIVVT